MVPPQCLQSEARWPVLKKWETADSHSGQVVTCSRLKAVWPPFPPGDELERITHVVLHFSQSTALEPTGWAGCVLVVQLERKSVETDMARISSFIFLD